MTILRSPIRGQILRSPLRSPIEDAAVAIPPTPPFNGLLAEYDAAAMGAFDVTLQGQTIAKWFDQTSNSFDASAVGTPTLDLGIQNGLPGVQMLGASSEYFDIGDLVAFEASNDFTIFVVVDRNATGVEDGFCTIQGQIAGAGGVCGIFMDTRTTFWRGLYSDGSFQTAASATTVPAAPTVLTYIKNGIDSEIFEGLTSKATEIALSPIDFTTSTTKRTILGAQWLDSGAGPTPIKLFDGIYFQFLFYTTAFDATDRTTMITHLGTKWGISV